MKVSLEQLYHYNCDRCKRWWTCADITPEINDTVICPHCGYVNSIEAIVSHEIKNKVGDRHEYPRPLSFVDLDLGQEVAVTHTEFSSPNFGYWIGKVISSQKNRIIVQLETENNIVFTGFGVNSFGYRIYNLTEASKYNERILADYMKRSQSRGSHCMYKAIDI